MTSTKKTGTKTTPSTVPVIVPPSTAVPTAVRAPAPAPEDRTSGTTPSEKAMEVMMIGRKRCRAAVTTASNRPFPASTCSRANSTIRMAFLPVSPITVSSPTWKKTPFWNPKYQAEASVPRIPTGIASMTDTGIAQLS